MVTMHVFRYKVMITKTRVQVQSDDNDARVQVQSDDNEDTCSGTK